jgi:hypothetical protein
MSKSIAERYKQQLDDLFDQVVMKGDGFLSEGQHCYQFTDGSVITGMVFSHRETYSLAEWEATGRDCRATAVVDEEDDEAVEV